MIDRQSVNIKRLWLVTAGAIIVLLLAGYYIVQKEDSTRTTETGGLESDINYGPPTDVEKAEGDKQKQENESRQEAIAQNQTTGTQKQVTPFISSWGQNPDNKSAEVNGFLTEIYEEGGTCTLIMQKEGKEVTVSRKAFRDAKTTNCGLLTIPYSQLSAGKWEAAISYLSPAAEGISQKVILEVK